MKHEKICGKGRKEEEENLFAVTKFQKKAIFCFQGQFYGLKTKTIPENCCHRHAITGS